MRSGEFVKRYLRQMVESGAIAPTRPPPPPDEDNDDVGTLLAPIEGVSLETYATIQARRGRVPNAAGQATLFAEYGLDVAAFARIEASWDARLGGDCAGSPTAVAALNARYRTYFAASKRSVG